MASTMGVLFLSVFAFCLLPPILDRKKRCTGYAGKSKIAHAARSFSTRKMMPLHAQCARDGRAPDRARIGWLFYGEGM